MQISWRSSLVAGGLSAIAASLCCLGPLVLLTLGVGGVWVGSLTAMEPYRLYFAGGTLLFLVLTYRQLYRVAPSCALDSGCADSSVQKRQRGLFWFVAALLLALLAVPWLASKL